MARPRPSDDAAGVIRAAGLRATTQRVAVLDALDSIAGDVTAQALHEQLATSGTDLGLATVYRALATLVDVGIVDSMQHGASTCFRRCAPGHHHHLTCDGCHRVIEIRDCEVDAWAERIGEAHGFAAVRHVVELHGTCPDCAA